MNCHMTTSRYILVSKCEHLRVCESSEKKMIYIPCVCFCCPPVEESRIYKAGGWIEFNRVNGRPEEVYVCVCAR